MKRTQHVKFLAMTALAGALLLAPKAQGAGHQALDEAFSRSLPAVKEGVSDVRERSIAVKQLDQAAWRWEGAGERVVGALGLLLYQRSGALRRYNTEYLELLISGLAGDRLRYKVRGNGVWLVEGADDSKREYPLILSEELAGEKSFSLGANHDKTSLIYNPAAQESAGVAVNLRHVLAALREIKLLREIEMRAMADVFLSLK